MADIYSTINSPGELATYATPKMYGTFGSGGNGSGGMGGFDQLQALLGNALAKREARSDALFKMQQQQFYAGDKSRMATATQHNTPVSYSNEMPTMSYVKNVSGFGMMPGAVQTSASDPGAVMGGWDPTNGRGQGAAHVIGGGGPIVPPSRMPDYGGGASGFEQGPQPDERADFYGLNSSRQQPQRGQSQLQALMQQYR